MRKSSDASEGLSEPPSRVLILGPVNSPHVVDLAVALRDRSVDVVVAGDLSPNQPATELPSCGVQVVHPPLRSRLGPLRLVRRISWLRHLVAEVRPDVVHAHVMTGDAFFAALARARPLVATAWGSDVLRSSSAGRMRTRIVVRSAQILTADSRDLLAALEAHGASSSRLALVHWGVDLDLFAPDRVRARARLALPPGPIVLSPRALSPVYNPELVLESFVRLLQEAPDCTLILKHYGDLPRGLDLDRFGDRVRVVGHVPVRELADYYRAADVCVSIASSDSSPRSVWEAMACGCPCVVSDLPWAREAIRPGLDALVVPLDADAVAAAFLRVLHEPGLAAELSGNGRRLVEREQSREAQISLLLALYGAVARP